MPTMKLTKATVAKLPAPDSSGKQVLYWDGGWKGAQPGFGVLCSGVTTAKTYVVQRSLNGRKRRVTLGRVEDYENAGKSVDDARTDAANLIHDLRAGRDPKARDYADTTLQQALDDYLASRPSLAERSKDGYRADIEGRFKAWLKRPLREVTPDMIEARFHAIKREVAARRGKRKRPELFVSEPGAAAADSALRALRVIWYHAHGRAPDAIPTWPAQRFKKQWHRVGRRERHVRGDDLATFYAAVNERDENGNFTLGRDMRDLALLLLFTGCRVGEATSLRWQDVDFAADVIRLPAKATKSKRRLDLPMSDLVRELMVARRALGTEGEYVFPSRGKTGHLTEPKGAFRRLSKRCGFPVNPHALRSTFITVAGGISMSPLAFKGLVNHAVDVADVTGGYVQEVELRKAAQAVARRLKQRCGIASPRGKNVRKLKAKRGGASL